MITTREILEANEKHAKEVASRTKGHTKSNGGELRDWFKEEFGDNFIIWGCLYNDPNKRWRDGTQIHTSIVQKMDVKAGVVETMNTLYTLGLPLGKGD